MKIVSKRGKKPEVIVTEHDCGGLIIIDHFGRMTPEETRRAEEAVKELRRQLEELGGILDAGWYNLPSD